MLKGVTVFGLTTVTLPLVELGGLAATYIVDSGITPAVPEPPRFELRVGTTTAQSTRPPVLSPSDLLRH
jgi:LacI family transcriptional regulator